MRITTEIFKTGAAQFNQCGQFLGYSLHPTNGRISQRIAKRLVKYAKIRIRELGLTCLINEWSVCVGTLDGSEPVMGRTYYVEWSNAEKTTISLVGIMFCGGHPTLDHGVEIQTN